ncbi:MAG: hypothetical protein WBR26_28160 [Candidatus Acidiferrum sp.]
MPTKEEVQQIVQAYCLHMEVQGFTFCGMQEEAASCSEELRELDPEGKLRTVFQEIGPEIDRRSKERGAKMGTRIGRAIRDQFVKPA